MPSPLSTTAVNDPVVVDNSTVAPPAVTAFPLASTNCTVTDDVLTPSATMLTGTALIEEVAGSGSPSLKTTVAFSPIAVRFSVPVIVAVPAVVEDKSVAVYVPSLLSVTPLRLPTVVASSTASPPTDRSLLPPSLTCTVIVDVLVPSASMIVGTAEINVVAASAVPTVSVTVAVAVIATPFSTPLTVATPPVVEEVSVAV